VKKCSTSLTIKEMQIKMTLRIYLTPIRMVINKKTKARAHKGGVRIDKTPKKQDSIRCPQCKETNAETLKRQRPIGERVQELEKRLVQQESI
jgi:hypothetical protein